MGKTAIFLGAGASKALGLPLTSDILPNLLMRLSADTVVAVGKPLFGNNARDRELLRRCLDAVLPGLQELSAGAADPALRARLPLITDVLSAIDYLLLSANTPGPALSLAELRRGRLLIERAVFELLVRGESPGEARMEGIPDSQRVGWEPNAMLQLLSPRSAEHDAELQRTVDWLRGLAEAANGSVAVISTNYDIEVEQTLYDRLGYHAVFDSVDFGVPVRDPDSGVVYQRPVAARYGVYKLHGSLNWLRCDVCDNVYLNPVGAIAYLSFMLGDPEAEAERPDHVREQLEQMGADQCHCLARPLRHVIVAPSFVREVRDPLLLGVWRSALEALRQADDWVIVGYSLPPEDVAIRSMFLRAFKGRDGGLPPRVVVVQHEAKEPELTRYQLLFTRQHHRYSSGGLSGYLASRERGT